MMGRSSSVASAPVTAPSAAATPGILRAVSAMLMSVSWFGLGSGAGELALGGLEHAGACLVGALVGADGLGAGVVGLAERGLDLGGGQLVVAGPRLVAAQRADASQDGRAARVAALVGVDFGEVDLRELGE